ncbi:response regulator [Flavobacterium granuli]|uniref:CheY-like chemotaxis protein n=1 Tax=Flavobacterium granuli TaxID=280093 RepID=A0ABU1S3U3_9FLAO|nr:response regulator [Flavobacterium granuli]MDR6845688.1 CheY-like chemotaxis protein [Flavobacterium granuli]
METNYAFLVIEDNQIDQFITKQLFKKILDISEINIVNNGKEGIKWVCENRKIINESLIILLDIQMPIMNGSQFLLEYEKLEDELKRRTQIFMLSSSLDTDEIENLKSNVYVTDFLNKPICVKEFGKRIYSNL